MVSSVNNMSDEGFLLLSVKGLCVSYGGKEIVKNISFDVPRGKIAGLIGLNGSGKTTTIKSVIGLTSRDSGEIFFHSNGKGNSATDNHADNIAYLPELFDPPPFLTGLEFIRFSLGLHGMRPDDTDILDFAKKLFSDESVLTRKMKTYSKGMRQKIGLITTFMTKSHLILLDEPMSGLDPMARNHTKNIIFDMKNNGRSVFFSSHIISDVAEICDIIYIMHDGELVFNGSADDLCRNGGSGSLETAFLNLIAAKTH